MSTKHRELLMELITKRFEKVLNEDALDTLQILMELYCDARALDMIEVDERPAVPAAQPKPKTAPKPPKKSKSGGADTDALADAILSAGEKPKQANAIAQEDKRRIYQLIRDGYAQDGETFLDLVCQAADGAVDRDEVRGMMNGLKFPIDRWRAVEQAIAAAGY